MKYQVGDLINYQPDDPTFETFDDALAYAKKEFEFVDQPVGIWTDEDSGGELVSIYYSGKLFTE